MVGVMGELRDRFADGWNRPSRAYAGRPRPDWYKWGGLALILFALLAALSK